MKFTTQVLLAITSIIGSTQASCVYEGGNSYCSQTSKVVYQGVGFSGSYQDITNMDEQTGDCSSQPFSFSGSLSPFDEQLSVHFRGPLTLKQFGVYYPASSTSNKKRDASCADNIHQHHVHKRAVVEVTQTVVVNAQGQTITPDDVPAAATSSSTSTAQVQNQPPSPSPSSSTGAAAPYDSPASSSSSSSSSSPSSSSSSPSGVTSGSWERVAYWSSGNAQNVTFLNNFGGSGSGVFSYTFGNSLSYANADASGGSSTPVAFDGLTIPSNTEFAIFSAEECDESCGYSRSGAPALKGFAGNQKIFVFEFEMPSAGSSSGFNYDMPAVWLLNAKIPRTLQYGDSSCSCWDSGCGELDLFEILSAGSDKCITHLHDKQGGQYGGGGSSDYFARPTSSTMLAACVFDGENIHVLEVSESFDSVLSASTVQGWIDQPGSVVLI